MRFFKIFIFALILFCSCTSFALTNSQKNYLMQEKGYSGEQIQAYEAKMKARADARSAGKELPALTATEQQMLNYAGSTDAINYGNEPGAWESFLGGLADKTGLADADTTGFQEGLETVGKWAGAIGLVSLGLATGGVLGLIPALAGLNMIDNLINGDKSSFNKILKAFASLNDGSWFSPVYEMLFNAINQLAEKINTNLQGVAYTVLIWLLLFYILFTVAKAVVSITPIEPSKLLTELGGPVLRCILAAILIKNIPALYDYFINPLLEMSAGIGIKVQEAMETTTVYQATVANGAKVIERTCTGSGAVVSNEVCNSVQTILSTICQNLIVWLAFGVTLIADCWGQWLHVFPDLLMLLTGLIITVFVFMVIISFPLKLLDAMFKLMFVVGLMPLWILFWVVPWTRGYTKKAFDMLINVMASLVCLSLVMVMVISILSSLFKGIPLSEIIPLLQKGLTEEAMDRIGLSSSGLFYSVCLLFMASHLVGQVDKFAEIFASAPDLGMNKMMSKRVTQGMQAIMTRGPSILKNGAKFGGRLVGGGAMMLASGAGYAIGKGKWAANRRRAQRYNETVPGGTSRTSPRLFTDNRWTRKADAKRAENQIGDYSRTRNVKASNLQKQADGSYIKTYSNETRDRSGKLTAKMAETSRFNPDNTSSVERTRQTVDATGALKEKTVRSKKFDKDGKVIGSETKTYAADGVTLKSSTVVDSSGNAVMKKYAADGHTVISEETRDKTTGSRTVVRQRADGSETRNVMDRSGNLRMSSVKKADGTEIEYQFDPKAADGKVPSFRRIERSGGRVTGSWKVNARTGDYEDTLSGTRGTNWGEFLKHRP